MSRFTLKSLSLLTLMAFLAQFCWLATAMAALPPSTQFDITGFLQEAALDGAVPAGGVTHQGGHLKVNGHIVTVPAETIVILPANALTWQELFTQAPAPYTNVATGMAMADVPAPMSTYEVHVIGNRVIGATDQYIAGLIYLSQQDLNSGAGYINFIDYTLGEMRVGGVIGDATTGTRVRINDPSARFGRANSPDPRFTVDPDNPTIIAATGFPMCLPRTDPAAGGDALCPQTNRLKDINGGFLSLLNMPAPTAVVAGGLDPRVQAPLEVGDYISFAGTLVNDSATPTVGPWPGTAFTYVSAHTIVNNTAIYTAAGTDPAYVSTEVALIGTGGLSVLGAGEAAIRTRFEGMTTDPSRNIHLYGMDLNPTTGAVTDRDWGTVGVDQGAPLGAVKGRWRFRPPCTATPSTITDKTCSPPPAGTFLPPTREVRAVIEGKQGTTATFANGIIAGQYHAPILEYIFPENIPGTPIVENNFNALDFLAKGGYASSAGTLVGQLTPWPSNNVPSAPGASTACAGIDTNIAIVAGSTEYRIGKQRLVINATDTVPGATLTLMPYKTATGTTFDPAALGNTFTLAGGLYTLTLVGAPEPAVPPATPLVVHSSSGGCTQPFSIDRIRQ